MFGSNEFILGESYENKVTGKSFLCIEEKDPDIPNDYAIGLEEFVNDDGEVYAYGDMVHLERRNNYYWI